MATIGKLAVLLDGDARGLYRTLDQAATRLNHFDMMRKRQERSAARQEMFPSLSRSGESSRQLVQMARMSGQLAVVGLAVRGVARGIVDYNRSMKEMEGVSLSAMDKISFAVKGFTSSIPVLSGVQQAMWSIWVTPIEDAAKAADDQIRYLTERLKSRTGIEGALRGMEAEYGRASERRSFENLQPYMDPDAYRRGFYQMEESQKWSDELGRIEDVRKGLSDLNAAADSAIMRQLDLVEALAKTEHARRMEAIDTTIAEEAAADTRKLEDAMKRRADFLVDAIKTPLENYSEAILAAEKLTKAGWMDWDQYGKVVGLMQERYFPKPSGAPVGGRGMVGEQGLHYFRTGKSESLLQSVVRATERTARASETIAQQEWQ